MFKKATSTFMKISLVLSFFLVGSTPIKAEEQQNVENDLDSFYEEFEQTDLDNYYFTLDENDDVHALTTARVIDDNYRRLSEKIETDDMFNSLIVDMLEKDAVWLAISVKTVYLKETDEQESVPLTKREVISTLDTGNISYSPTNTFKLYTSAGISNGKIYGTSAAEFYTNKGGDNNNPKAGCYDYIGLMMPEQYVLTDEKLSNTQVRPYLASSTSNGAVMGVLLKPSPSVAGFKSISLSGYGIKNADVQYKKVISHYVHNWKSPKLELSISYPGGISLGTTDKNWQVSSYVIIQ